MDDESLSAALLMNDLVPTSRIRSSPRPPLYVVEREQRNKRDAEAIRRTWSESSETLHGMLVSTPSGERYDQERMRNMVAPLRTMVSSWPKAIGQKQPGAAKGR